MAKAYTIPSWTLPLGNDLVPSKERGGTCVLGDHRPGDNEWHWMRGEPGRPNLEDRIAKVGFVRESHAPGFSQGLVANADVWVHLRLPGSACLDREPGIGLVSKRPRGLLHIRGFTVHSKAFWILP